MWGVLATLFALAGMGAIFYNQFQTQQSLLAEQHTMALDVAYRATLETYRLDVETRYRLQVMRPDVLDLVAEALDTPEARMPVVRGRLFRLLKPVYAELQGIGLRQFQFHLADDRVLLRFHLPHMAGDPLFELRPSLRIANTEKRPVVGLEVGRTQPGFRHVFPLIRDGRHLGSVELSLPFELIQESLTHLLKDGDFGFLLHKDAVLGKVDVTHQEKYVEASLHPGFLTENPTISRVARNFEQAVVVRALDPRLRADVAVQARMSAGESFVVPLLFEGQGYAVTFLALPDLSGKPVAYIVRYVRTGALGKLNAAAWGEGALAMLLVLALAISGYWLRSQSVQLRADIARRQAAESGLKLYENIFNHSGEAIVVTDGDNRIVTVNAAFTQLTGYVLDDVRGQNPKILSSGNTPRETYQMLWASLQAEGHWQGELLDRRKDGQTYPKWASISAIRDATGGISHYFAAFTDISARKAAEARIERLAHHDPLTGLLNRYSLESRLEQGLLGARREGQHLAVLFIDMDRFKGINDTLGHQVGDHMLQEVAVRLQGCVRESDIVARLGGDEFVVVLTALGGVHEAAPVLSKLMHRLSDDYCIDGHSLHSTPSVGVAMFPEDGESVEMLLKHADAAMYCAKDRGRNNMQYFTAALTAAAEERREIEHELHRALADQEFELYYQLQVCASDGRIGGVEALLRWHHPERGMVPPDRFIPIAEEAGLIEAIGAWVLDEACRQLAAWQRDGIADLRMAVNLSAYQLRSPHLLTLVSGCLSEHHILPAHLELEVTESAAMESPEQAIDQLRALRDMGIYLSIDDFGTGYSSLAYLKHLPIHTLKLDRSFVRDIETDANDAAISAATVALAHKLGLLVVAEGVETAAQAKFLGVDHGCDILQGYLFARPEPAGRVVERLKERVVSVDFSCD